MKKVTLKFRSFTELFEFKHDARLVQCQVTLSTYLLSCCLTEQQVNMARFYGAELQSDKIELAGSYK